MRHSFAKLAPRVQFRNQLSLGIYAGAIFTSIIGVVTSLGPLSDARRAAFSFSVAAWLWLSIVLAEFVETLADDWAKAREATLRSKGSYLLAKQLLGRDRSKYHLVEADTLHRGDIVLVEANEVVPADGTVIEGAASVSEGAITGESAPVLRAAGGTLAFVRRGTHVLSDWLVVRVKSREGFFDPIITIAQEHPRPRTPPEIVLSLLLLATTLAFLLGMTVIAPSLPSAIAGTGSMVALSALVMLVVCLIPIATRAAIATIGILSIARLMRANVIATAGGAVEAAAEIDVLVLDKTGTITRGDRHAVAVKTAPGIATRHLLEVAELASLADETPEGRSIVALVTQLLDQRPSIICDPPPTFLEFSAQTRISGVDLQGRRLRKGAADAVRHFVEKAGGSWPAAVSELIADVARSGATPLVVADGADILGVIELRDIVKAGIREHCVALRPMGIKTIMVTGDHQLTAMTIAAEIGVDDFLAEATPDKKRDLIREYQNKGHRVAMCGDGTNDAPALAQADVAVAMSSGTRAAK
jgi:K+-transporting ATPase ATPase B chain